MIGLRSKPHKRGALESSHSFTQSLSWSSEPIKQQATKGPTANQPIFNNNKEDLLEVPAGHSSKLQCRRSTTFSRPILAINNNKAAVTGPSILAPSSTLNHGVSINPVVINSNNTAALAASAITTATAIHPSVHPSVNGRRQLNRRNIILKDRWCFHLPHPLLKIR